MKRDIIFRGKDSNGEWLYGNLIDCQGFQSILTIDETLHTPIDFLGSGIIRGKVDEKTVGQFSGLYDSNNIPIYEGDIVQLGFEEYQYPLRVCRWSEEDAAFGLFLRDAEWAFIKGYDLREFSSAVVGNIHDNPKLLED